MPLHTKEGEMLNKVTLPLFTDVADSFQDHQVLSVLNILQFHATLFPLICFNFTCCLFKMQHIFPSVEVRQKNLLIIPA